MTSQRVAARFKDPDKNIQKKTSSKVKVKLKRTLASLVKKLLPGLDKIYPADIQVDGPGAGVDEGYFSQPNRVFAEQTIRSEDYINEFRLEIVLAVEVADDVQLDPEPPHDVSHNVTVTPQPTKVLLDLNGKKIETTFDDDVDARDILRFLTPHLKETVGLQTIVWYGYIVGDDGETWVVGFSQKDVGDWAESTAKGMNEESVESEVNDVLRPKRNELELDERDRVGRAYDEWERAHPEATEDEADKYLRRLDGESDDLIEKQLAKVENEVRREAEERDYYGDTSERLRIEELPFLGRRKTRIIEELTKRPKELVGS